MGSIFVLPYGKYVFSPLNTSRYSIAFFVGIIIILNGRNVDARCLTLEEGLRLAREQRALKDAQEQRKREAQEQRAAKEAERERFSCDWRGTKMSHLLET